MRLSFIPSLALHIGAVAIFLPAISDAWRAETQPMLILPVELLEIDDTTNMTAASEAPKEEVEPETAPTQARRSPTRRRAGGRIVRPKGAEATRKR